MSQSARYVLCPYCGRMQPGPDAERCDECGGYFEPLSRRATQIAMGPWYIRDKRVPFRPGCSYEVLVSQIKAGRIKPNTVIRGPTTRQFWSVARNVPGVAHLLGYCHRCGAHVSPNDKACPDCAEPFMAVTERNELGLLYPTAKEAAAAQRALQRELSGEEAEPAAATGTGTGQPPATGDEATGGDLVEQVLGLRATGAPGQQAGRSAGAPSRQEPAPGQVGQLAATGIASGGGAQGAGSSILDFRPGSGAATAGGESGGSDRQLPGAGHGLDFAPSDAEEEQAASSGQSAATWILALINVLALIAVLVLVILFLRGQQGDEATRAEDAQGPEIAYNTGQNRGEAAGVDPAERGGAPTPAQEQSPEDNGTPEPAPDSSPDDDQGAEVGTPNSAPDPFAPQPPAAPQAPATPQVPLELRSPPTSEGSAPAGDDDPVGEPPDGAEAPGGAEFPSRQPPRQRAPSNTPTFFGVPLNGDNQTDEDDENATESDKKDRADAAEE